MVSSQQVLDVIRRGIVRFEKPYNAPASRIQVVFKLDEKNNVTYLACLDEEPRNTVTIKDLIGVNLYNMVVTSHIKGLLLKFAKETGLPPSEINLQAGLTEENKVYVILRNNKKLIRVIDNPDELKK